MKIEIEIPEGLGLWLKDQKNWDGVVVEAVSQYRQLKPYKADPWELHAAITQYRNDHKG